MSIVLVDGANEKVKKLVYQKETQAYYKSVQERVEKNFATAFATDIQILITKVAKIIDEVAVSVKLKTCYFLTAIDYLCKKVLNDEDLYDDLRATKINENANKNKHSIDSIEINIGQCVNQYNRLINQLNSNLKLPALSALRITAQRGVASTPKAETKKSAPAKTAKPVKAATPAKPVKPANPKASFNDAVGKLTVELSTGLGRITKGLINKREILNCNLSVDYEGDYPVKKITAYVDGNSEGFPVQAGDNVLELDLDNITLPRVSITVTAIIKLGIFSTKTLKVTVSRDF